MYSKYFYSSDHLGFMSEAPAVNTTSAPGRESALGAVLRQRAGVNTSGETRVLIQGICTLFEYFSCYAMLYFYSTTSPDSFGYFISYSYLCLLQN